MATGSDNYMEQSVQEQSEIGLHCLPFCILKRHNTTSMKFL